MRELIEAHFAAHLGPPAPDTFSDAVALDLAGGDAMVTTDGFSVQPLEFPGGTIGSLAVHGTLNDLAVAGADPVALTLNAFIEEGLSIDQLDRIVMDLAQAARTVGVAVVAGDTKVVPRGQGGGLYLATTGIGLKPDLVSLGPDRINAGDELLVSGPVGDHAIAVLLAREAFGLRSDLRSDSACVLALTRRLRDMAGVRFMRDPTRGGLATVAHELSRVTGRQVILRQQAIPIRSEVRAVCEMLGYDPLYLACEGRVVAVVSPEQAAEALRAWRDLPQGRDAARIGRIAEEGDRVVLQTSLGGERFLEELEDDPLPRIC